MSKRESSASNCGARHSGTARRLSQRDKPDELVPDPVVAKSSTSGDDRMAMD